MIVIDSAKNIKCNECERATRLFPDGHTLDFHIWLNLCVLCEAFANTYCYLLRPACRASPGIWPSVQVCQGLAGQLEEAGDRGGGREGGSGSCLQRNRYLKHYVIVLDSRYLMIFISWLDPMIVLRSETWNVFLGFHEKSCSPKVPK